MLVWQFTHIILSISKGKTISKESLLYSTLFVIIPIIFEGLKLFIDYLKKKDLP